MYSTSVASRVHQHYYPCATSQRACPTLSHGTDPDRLRAQLASLRFPIDAGAHYELKQRVCDYVDALRALGWPPERVIVALRRITAEAGIQPSAHVTLVGQLTSDRDQLLVTIVKCCLERYSDPSQRT